MAADEDVRARMARLVEAINRNDRLYYVEARPVVSDADYDRMYEELLALEREYPQFKDPNSPTVRVSGAPIEGFAQVRHEPPMKSLDKCYEKGDLVQFDTFLRREMPAGSRWRYVVEPKVDGVSISLLYEGRRLVRAAIRERDRRLGLRAVEGERELAVLRLRSRDGALHHAQVEENPRAADDDAAAANHKIDRPAVVFDEKPVANIEPFAVNRKRLATKGVSNHQRNQFFGKLIRAVIVGAAGNVDWQSIGFTISPDH